jgi:hypothetical protein
MPRKRKKKSVSPILKDLADKVTAEGKIGKFLFYSMRAGRTYCERGANAVRRHPII